MLIKLFVQEVSQCTLKCSTEIKISGFMDFQMHPPWMWMWDVGSGCTQVFRFYGSSDARPLDYPIWM